ncbi:AAA family ATPase [Gracilinema caldarium]|uniref:ATPase associated with various cellular activities AAA_3 n=1 Tax=Gracilinema caldarium (strain ATCC 51460 / DSM 7334 / H1) TaxID=744872 RepID=F8F3A8_GRAC1|nr:MoxR family ATPase [Gracilinema caldarium]AEJ20945.1 ATPase associated with various cellular activities AAA_3 [Gracilinema caldarium DSM 7334]
MDYKDVPSALLQGASQVIKGKETFLEYLISVLLAGGHVLLEDLPGLGKTTVAKTISRLIAAENGGFLAFKRIQFTPDLLPYDITGVDIFDPDLHSFRFVPGPIFANLILADEINRTTPKVQSALLEVMAELQVTVGSVTRPVPAPFMVIATQNPVESEGTFPLPAAQLDRFMMRLSLGYPPKEAELEILDTNPAELVLTHLEPIISIQDFLQARAFVDQVYCHPGLKETIVDLVRATRNHSDIRLGASSRSALHLLKTARAYAFVKGRDYVIDEDIINLSSLVLAHRIKMTDPRTDPSPLLRRLALENCKKHDFQ